MQYIPTAEIKMDLTKAPEEIQQLILIISMSQLNQYEFLKHLDLWLGETLAKIEDGFPKEQQQEEKKEAG